MTAGGEAQAGQKMCLVEARGAYDGCVPAHRMDRLLLAVLAGPARLHLGLPRLNLTQNNDGRHKPAQPFS